MPGSVLTQALDYLDECNALHDLLAGADDDAWERPTQFKGWTFNDVVGHLFLFDRAARLTLQDPPAFAEFMQEKSSLARRGRSLKEYTRTWIGDSRGRVLLARWAENYHEVSGIYAAADPRHRVAWAGPGMSVRSCISARQMETWAHGQAVFDALGRVRVEHDRIKNIAIMGINTFAWTFANRALSIPPVKPFVRLTSPGGAVWEWNEHREDPIIEGTAVDFCRVVTQTRNVADTDLRVAGEAAKQWMVYAQCFAGPPEQPPAPGSRFARVPARPA